MAITHTYSYKRFDPVNATLTIEGTSTDTLTSTTLSYTRILPLPVNSSGNVPVGTALNAYVETFLDGLIAPDLTRKANLAPYGGQVNNANTIFSLTTDVEAGEVTGIAVNLYADQDFRNIATNQVTRSVMEVVTLDQYGYGIDNGNFADPAYLSNIQSPGFPDVAGPVVINYSSFSLTPPAKYSAQYGSTIFYGTGAGTFVGQRYYIEHPPILMYNQATALFHYN